MWGSNRYHRPQRKRETSKVDIPESIVNEFAVVLWYYNERLNRDEGFINHHLYGDIHFWKSALNQPSESSSLKENVPVVFSGHKKNEEIVVDRLILAKSSVLNKELTERLIQLVFCKWKHSYYWKTICIDAISNHLDSNEQTNLFISLVRELEQKNTLNETILNELISFFTKLDHAKLDPIFKQYLSEYKYYFHAIKHNVPLDEQSNYKAISYILLNGKYESAVSDLLLALQQSNYGFQTGTIINILKQLKTEEQFYKTIHLDLFNSGFSWSMIKAETRIGIIITNLESFNKWYQAQVSFEFEGQKNMDSVSKKERVSHYINNFSLFIDFNNWAEAFSLGFSFFTLMVDDILQHCRHSSEMNLWAKINRICDSATDKMCLSSIKDTALCLAKFVNQDTLHLWRIIHACNSCSRCEYSDIAIRAFEMIPEPEAKAAIWAIYHNLEFHVGFGIEQVLASLINLSKENQCRIFNRLIAESKTMEEVKHISHLDEIRSLGNSSIEKFKLYLNYIYECKASSDINKSVISSAYIRLLIHSEGIAELEYYLPMCNIRNIPTDIMVSKSDTDIKISFKGDHRVHIKMPYGYLDNGGFNNTNDTLNPDARVFGNIPLLNQNDQNSVSVDTPVFCEGRLVKNEKSKIQPSFSKEFDIPYYWCYNRKCIFPTMEYAHGIVHNHKYSSSFEVTASYKFGLLNILKLWGADFKSSMMANIVCASMNSAQRLFGHLKCRECGVYMIPSKTSNYAYYQTHVYKCETCGIEVYLSHCLNPNCTDIIDSRDCSKCPNGWFICKSCLACCNNDKFEIRTHIRKETGQSEVKLVGHKGKHMFCPQCGQQLDGSNNRNPEKQRQIIDYLEKADRRLVRSKGIRDGHWYLVNLKDYGSKLKDEIPVLDIVRRFASYGLSVKKSDIATPEQPWYFVSDSIKEGDLYAGAFTLSDIGIKSNIICNCGYSLRGSFTIVSYHNREKRE